PTTTPGATRNRRSYLLTALRLNRPPHQPALLPYTTLFRSRKLQTRFRKDSARGRGRPHTHDARRDARSGRGNDASLGREPVTLQDRKSTRLNSSHRTISYAVFCLKKKTRTSAPLASRAGPR